MRIPTTNRATRTVAETTLSPYTTFTVVIRLLSLTLTSVSTAASRLLPSSQLPSRPSRSTCQASAPPTQPTTACSCRHRPNSALSSVPSHRARTHQERSSPCSSSNNSNSDPWLVVFHAGLDSLSYLLLATPRFHWHCDLRPVVVQAQRRIREWQTSMDHAHLYTWRRACVVKWKLRLCQLPALNRFHRWMQRVRPWQPVQVSVRAPCHAARALSIRTDVRHSTILLRQYLLACTLARCLPS